MNVRSMIAKSDKIISLALLLHLFTGYFISFLG